MIVPFEPRRKNMNRIIDLELHAETLKAVLGINDPQRVPWEEMTPYERTEWMRFTAELDEVEAEIRELRHDRG